MRTKISKILIIILLASGILNTPSFVMGQGSEAVNDEVKKLNREIEERRNKIKKMQEQQEAYSQNIRQKQEEKASLENELSILDNRLAKAELDIESAQIEIERVNLEIKKTDIEILAKTSEINKEKEQIETALRLIDKEDKTGTLEILLLNDSLTEFLSQVKYLEDINKELGDSLDSLKNYKEQLEKNKEELGQKNKELADFKKELGDKKLALEGEKGNKDLILDQTRSSEREFQRLLAQAKEEQRAAASDITSLEKLVREKIAKMSEKKLEFNDNGFIWPVPRNTITSYFHDPEYPFRYIFEHPAIDIRAPQGNMIRSAASGYVARAKDAGKGYSYIMIVHGDGLSTVYGHVSKIYVNEDEYVIQGQPIGLSGGLPGTPGAGRLTTGSHLHFEVRSNGIPVNPLEYLP